MLREFIYRKSPHTKTKIKLKEYRWSQAIWSKRNGT